MLSKEPSSAESIGIHLIHQWIRILRQTSSENNDLVVVSHDPQEIVDAGSFLYEDLADVAIDIDWDDEVWVLDLVKLTVDQRLVQVENKCLHALAPIGRWSQQSPAHLLLSLVVAALGSGRHLYITTLSLGPILG